MANTTMNRVSNPSKSLIAESKNSIKTLVRWNTHEYLRGIASTKNFVNRSEMRSALNRWVKVWCKYAFLHALFPHELAGTTRPTSSNTTEIHFSLSSFSLECCLHSADIWNVDGWPNRFLLLLLVQPNFVGHNSQLIKSEKGTKLIRRMWEIYRHEC